MNQFLSLNGHIAMMWTGTDSLLAALHKLVGDRNLRLQFETFFEVDAVELYYEYTQLTDDQQYLLSLECKAKYNATIYRHRV